MSEPRQLLSSESAERLAPLFSRLIHDFNNHLAAIIGFSDLMRTPAITDDKRLKFANRIYEQSMRLTQMLEVLSHFSAPPPAEPGFFDPVRTVSEWSGTRRQGLEAMGVLLDLSLGNDVPRVYADRGAVIRALNSVLTNAEQILKENPSCTRRVLIRVASVEVGLVGIDIADAGPGVADGLRDAVFEPFFTTRRSGGLGLGLTVSRQQLRLLGGDVVLAARVEGYPGACFRLLLKTEKPGE